MQEPAGEIRRVFRHRYNIISWYNLRVYVEYFHWQFVVAPWWMLRLFGNVQQALIQFFSVPYMIKTLFAYWHKDSVSYLQGSFTGMVKALAWNIISRGMGCFIRSVVLVLWLVSEILLVVVSAVLFIGFLLWPLLFISGLATGLVLVILW
jgi:hypothetical protein